MKENLINSLKLYEGNQPTLARYDSVDLLLPSQVSNFFTYIKIIFFIFMSNLDIT